MRRARHGRPLPPSRITALNILIGTNVADAVECIPKHAIEGGFLGRVAVIHASTIPRPHHPAILSAPLRSTRRTSASTLSAHHAV